MQIALQNLLDLLWPLALLPATGPVASVPQVPAQASLQLTTVAVVGEPLLVEVSQNFTLDLGALQTKFSRDMSFVDEYQVLEGKNDVCDRYFLRVHDEVDGDVADPPLAGVQFRFTQAFGETRLTIENDAHIPEPSLTQMLAMGDSMGCRLAFPANWQVGQERELDLMPVASLLIGWEHPVEQPIGTFKFESFDAQSGLATFSGQLTFAQTIERGPLVGVATWIGDCTLQNDVRQQRLASIQYRGRVKFLAEGEAKAGHGTFRVELSGTKGEPAQTALASTPAVRDRLFHFPALEVSLELPSTWALSPRTEDQAPFLFWTRGKPKAAVTIELMDVQMEESSLRDATSHLKEAYRSDPTFKALTSVKSKFGAGVAVEFEVTHTDGSPLTLLSEFYLRGERWLLVKYQGTPDAFKALRKDLERARKSLKSAKR